MKISLNFPYYCDKVKIVYEEVIRGLLSLFFYQEYTQK